jgi:LmbE family N-acetylglucosaminyl deacetylase
MTPSFVVDITDELPTKLRALGCYRSQFVRAAGRSPTVLNDPAWLRRVETAARTYGELIGRPAGEPYAVDGPVPLADPVAALCTEREVVP